MDERQRNPDVERLERDSFVVLQHAYNWQSEDGRRLSAWVIGSDLGLSPGDCTAIIGQLAFQGYLTWSGSGPGLRISPLGIDYVERLAGRRRSVRFGPEVPKIIAALGC